MNTALAGVRLAALAWISATSLAGANAPEDGEWPQFRGPLGRGLSTEPAPIVWDAAHGTNVRWEIPAPGLGHGGPVVWRDRVYVATAVRPGAKPDLRLGIYGAGDSYAEKEPHQWRLLCLNTASGATVWDTLAFEGIPSQARHTKGSHCNSTPATDGKRIVATLGSEGLFCFDLDGRLLWRHRLGPMDIGPWDAPELRWGFASSPLLHDGRVFIQCDAFSGQYVAALSAQDGRELWRTERREVPNWCTPAISPEAGQIVLNGWKQIAGYDLASGRLLWEMSGGGDIPVPAPVTAGALAFLTSAHGKFRPLQAVRLASRGNVTPRAFGETNQAVAWCYPRLGSYMQTPIVVGPRLWSCDWYGVLSCIEIESGKRLYSERLGGGGQAFTASPVAAGNHLYFTSEAGDVYVVATGPEFRIEATNHLNGSVLATPAVARGALYFRTTEKIVAVAARP